MATTDGYFQPNYTPYPAYPSFPASPPAGYAPAGPQPTYDYAPYAAPPPQGGEPKPPLVSYAHGSPPTNYGYYPAGFSAPYDTGGFVPPTADAGHTPYFTEGAFPPSTDSASTVVTTYTSPGFAASQQPTTSSYSMNSSPYSMSGSLSYSAPTSPYTYPSSPRSSAGSSKRAQHFQERPSQWRPDFTLRGPGLAAFIPSLPRRNSVQNHHSSLVLNDRIRYAALRDPPVVFDLRHDISRIQIRELRRPVTNYDLTRYVTEPPIAHVRLYHPRLPWYIDVKTPGQAGVTMYDLFTYLSGYLLSRVKDHDLYNSEVLNEDRDKITLAWKERCQFNERAMAQGVKKVDFMMRDHIFIGLAKGKDGMFEIKTRKA